MKNNQPRTPTSVFYLKQQFISILSNEFKTCSFDIVLGFESSCKDRLFTLKITQNRRVDICLNLGYINKSIKFKGCSLNLKIKYCALFITEYIKQIELSQIELPHSYFNGLVFFNAIAICKAEKKTAVYSPLSLLISKVKRKTVIRPIEIISAINSLNKLKIIAFSEFTPEEQNAIDSFSDRLLLYSGLPEISYVHSILPVYALIDSIKIISEIVKKDRNVTREFPILSVLPLELSEQITVRELFLSCIESNTPFLSGIAIRLLAFLDLPYSSEYRISEHTHFVKEIKKYVEYSIDYIKDLNLSGEYLLKDNLFAIKKAVNAITCFLAVSGIEINSGNIHVII